MFPDSKINWTKKHKNHAKRVSLKLEIIQQQLKQNVQRTGNADNTWKFKFNIKAIRNFCL